MFHTTFSGLFSIAPPPDKRLKGLIRKSRDKQTQLDTYVWDSGATKYELQMENGIQGQPNTADGEWDTGATTVQCTL